MGHAAACGAQGCLVAAAARQRTRDSRYAPAVPSKGGGGGSFPIGQGAYRSGIYPHNFFPGGIFFG
jgi:hypothetical protein